MTDVLPIKKITGALQEFQTGDKIPYAYLGIDGQLGGFRNKIINGKMEIAQRGTSFPAIAGNSYSLDRWAIRGQNLAGAYTVSQQADAPTDRFQYSLRLAVTTANASVASNHATAIGYSIEGYDSKDIIGVPVTVSFWVRSSKVGTYCISFINSVADRSFVVDYSVSVANTWEYKIVKIPTGLITSGTWNWANGVGLILRFALAAGTGLHTAAGTWQTGNFYSTSGQVNCLDTVGNIFAITGVQLEVGSVATPFEHRPYGQELALCQRYYETGRVAVYTSADTPLVRWDFKVEKRAVPTIAGGGAGFTSEILNRACWQGYQTVANYNSLAASAEL